MKFLAGSYNCRNILTKFKNRLFFHRSRNFEGEQTIPTVTTTNEYECRKNLISSNSRAAYICLHIRTTNIRVCTVNLYLQPVKAIYKARGKWGKGGQNGRRGASIAYAIPTLFLSVRDSPALISVRTSTSRCVCARCTTYGGNGSHLMKRARAPPRYMSQAESRVSRSLRSKRIRTWVNTAVSNLYARTYDLIRCNFQSNWFSPALYI